MTMIRDTVIHHIEQQGWHYEQVQDRDAISFNLNTEVSSYRLVLDFRGAIDVVILYVMNDQNVIEGKRTAVAEYITRINYGLILGGYEMDFDDGEIRYKVSIDVEDGELSNTMVATMIAVAITSMDLYFAGLMAIQYGDTSPSEAIERAESKPDSSSGASADLSVDTETSTLLRIVN